MGNIATVLDMRERMAGFLYKLAIRTVNLSYRTLPLERTFYALDKATGSMLSSISEEYTPPSEKVKARKRQEEGKRPLSFSDRLESPPTSGIPRLLFIAAARTTAGPAAAEGEDVSGFKVKAVFGPFYSKSRAGKVMIATPSILTWDTIPSIVSRLDKAFGAPGRYTVGFGKLLREEDKSSYRIEPVSRRTSSGLSYAIVHSGGPNDGRIFQRKYTKKNVESYRDDIYPTLARATRRLSMLTKGIPSVSKAISPRSSLSLLPVVLRYEVLITSESSPDVSSVIEKALSEVDPPPSIPPEVP